MEEDLSRTCRRDSYCMGCWRAFCSHCCYEDHCAWRCSVIPVGVDDAGQRQPTFCKRYPPDGDPIKDYLVNLILEQDFAARFARDAYCIRCGCAFSTGICQRHHRDCGRDRIVRRIEERDGRHYIRCRGDEKWLAHVERILGDPVVGEDYTAT